MGKLSNGFIYLIYLFFFKHSDVLHRKRCLLEDNVFAG